jgi:serine/threonine-protein kinase
MENQLVGLIAELLEIEMQPQARTTLSAGSTSVSGASDFYLQGMGYLRRFDKAGNLEQSVAAFQNALKLDPHYALAFTGLAEAYLRTFQRGKDPQWLPLAQDAGARAVELNGRLAPAHVRLGTIFAATGQYPKAVGEFKRALELDRLSADAYRELAGAYESLNQAANAENTYRTAIDLRPADWLSNGMLAAFYYRHGRYADAEAYFKRIIDLTPDNANGYLNLGVIYIVLDRYAEAETLLQKAIQIKPTDRAYSNLGTAYYQLGRYAEACPMYEQAVQVGAGASWTTVGNLADCYRRVPELRAKAPEKYAAAIQLAERQLALNPKDSGVLKSLAFYRAVSGDRNQALRDIKRARELAPADTTVGFKAVLVDEILGRRKQALASLEQVLKDGFAIGQVEREPDLEHLRQDAGYARIKSRFSAVRNSSTPTK